MRKYPILLNFSEILAYIDSLENTSKKISYCKYLLSVFRESFNNETDEDVDKYVEKYKLHDAIRNINHQLLFESHFYEVDDIFSKPYYNKLHETTSHLARYLTGEVGRLEIYKRTIEDNLELLFFSPSIYAKLDLIQSDKEKLLWLKTLIIKLESIFMMFTNQMLNKVIENFSLDEYFVSSRPNQMRNENDKRLDFRLYLRSLVFDDLNKYKNELTMNIALEDAKYYLQQDHANYEFLFFLWNYEYEKIKYYSDRAFESVKLKIQYFSYVVKSLNIEIGKNTIKEQLYVDLPKLKEELNYLKTIYDLEVKSGNNEETNYSQDLLGKIQTMMDKLEISINTKSLKNVPASKNYFKLAQQYFSTAIKISRVPKLEDLSYVSNSLSFWSKLFDDKTFLIYLITKVNKKLNHKRITKSKKYLYLDLRDDLKSKVNKITSKERDSTNQTDKRNREYDENRISTPEENPYLDGDYLS